MPSFMLLIAYVIGYTHGVYREEPLSQRRAVFHCPQKGERNSHYILKAVVTPDLTELPRTRTWLFPPTNFRWLVIASTQPGSPLCPRTDIWCAVVGSTKASIYLRGYSVRPLNSSIPNTRTWNVEPNCSTRYWTRRNGLLHSKPKPSEHSHWTRIAS